MLSNRNAFLRIAGWLISVDSIEPGFLIDRSGYQLFEQTPGQPQDAAIDFFFPNCSINARFYQAGPEERQQLLFAELQKQDLGLSRSELSDLQFNACCAFSFSGEKKLLRVFSPKTQKPTVNLSVPFMYLLANLGAKTDGIYLHGAGAAIGGRAFAILGIPEAGKSTSIAMIKHDFLLSDDMVMMRFKDGTPILHATPLGPNTDGPGSAPLTTIFYPVKSDHFELKPLSRLKAIEHYYHAQAGYWNKVFKPYRQQHFEKVVQLFSQVQAYEMHFTRDYIDNDAIRKAMQA